MKKLTFDPAFLKQLSRMKKKDTRLFGRIEKQLLIFRSNPSHPSLRLHKLRGELKDVWSLSVTTDFRLLFVEDDEYYFFDMGTHDQVYKK